MNPDAVRAWSRTVVHDYTLHDAALYALAIGAVSDPLDVHQLRLADEVGQVAVPSMASVIASPGFWARDEKSMEIDAARLVHAEDAGAFAGEQDRRGLPVADARPARARARDDRHLAAEAVCHGPTRLARPPRPGQGAPPPRHPRLLLIRDLAVLFDTVI